MYLNVYNVTLCEPLHQIYMTGPVCYQIQEKEFQGKYLKPTKRYSERAYLLTHRVYVLSEHRYTQQQQT